MFEKYSIFIKIDLYEIINYLLSVVLNTQKDKEVRLFDNVL